MKIFKLPVEKALQPERQNFLYPKHNADYGVEQDFERYLESNKHLLTDNIAEADWHYLPVYWTRWHLKHDYGRSGSQLLAQYTSASIVDDRKTFTICQYDDGPMVNLGNTIEFLASRKSAKGCDIPLLCSEHKRKLSFLKPYYASFAGRLNTHPIRLEMRDVMHGKRGVLISEIDLPTNKYVKLITQSLVALCPRGYGGSSFRFFEAMQLGVVPALLGDLDTRPFKNFIEWDQFSLYSDNPHELIGQIMSYSPYELRIMGRKAKEIYINFLAYQKWPKLLLKELSQLS